MPVQNKTYKYHFVRTIHSIIFEVQIKNLTILSVSIRNAECSYQMLYKSKSVQTIEAQCTDQGCDSRKHKDLLSKHTLSEWGGWPGLHIR